MTPSCVALIEKVLHDRADGSFVRVSTTIDDGDRDTARSRLVAFDGSFDALLAAHWPREIRANQDGDEDLVSRTR